MDAIGIVASAALSVTVTAGGGGIPDWAAALRDLVSDPADFLFAYNFATGGTGEGWNNVTQQLLSLDDAWQFGSGGGAIGGPYTGDIVDGLGVEAVSGSANIGLTVSGLLPDLSAGATLLMQAQPNAPATIDTGGHPFLHLVDIPGDNHEGGIDLRWDVSVDRNRLILSNGDGGSATVDTIAGKVSVLRGACNYTTDGSDIVGSFNGRPNETVGGSIVGVAPDTLSIDNSLSFGSDLPIYLTIAAVFALQDTADLPAMSALP